MHSRIPGSRKFSNPALNPGIWGLTKFMYLTVFKYFLKIILCIYSFFDAFLSPSDEGRGPSCSADMLCIQNPESLSVKEQLNLAISDSLQPPPQQHSGTSNLATVIRQEIALFEGGGSRGRTTSSVCLRTCSLCHLSVEAERVFSAAGIVCSRLRTRLDDATLDNLCFLRTSFAAIVLSEDAQELT